MSTRSVIVRLEAEVSRFVLGMGKAAKATEDAKKAQEELGKTADETAKKSSQASEQAAKELAKLAAAHQEAAKAAGLQYNAAGQLVDGNGRILSSSQATAHGLDTFSEAVYKTGFEAEQAAESQRKAAETARAAGTQMLGFGALTVAGLGASAKAAMDWESAWAGVTKTVNGTPAEMDQLEVSLRGLAKTLPLTHTEIAGVAEAAGQLGVARQDIAGFTKTMVDLGVSTNLTADDAATQIAQISNVMGTMAREGSLGVSRFGATLVALGNDGASTESEILAMAQRIAGAAATVGASETDVLALSNTLASMGVKAELGGGVTTRVLLKMYEAVQEGGDHLDAFAKTAGTSSAEFAKAFGDSPVAAMDKVNKGLARVKAEGGNVVQAMKDMGIKGTEEYQVMLALASSGDLLSDSLALGSKAWKENVALVNEASKRYETTESKVKIAWNNIKDAAIDAGAALLPVIQGVAESVSGLAQTFGSLPEPVKGAVVMLAGVTGGAALLAGGLLTVLPKIADTRTAFKDLTASGSKAPGVLLGIGKAAGVAAAAYAAVTTAAALAAAATEGSRGKTSVEDFNNALVGVSTNGDKAKTSLDAAFKGVLKPDLMSGGTTAVNSFGDALDRVFNGSWQDKATDFTGTLFGQNATTGINTAKDAIGNYDKSLASMATSGNLQDAAAGFTLASEEAKKHGTSVEQLIELFPEYKAAILANKTANGETQVSQEALTTAMLKADPASKDAAKGADILKDSIDGTGVALGGVIADMDKFLEQLFATGQITMSARDAEAAYNEALRGVPEVMKKIADSKGAMGRTLNDTATDFDLTTEAGAAANAALQDIARKGMAEVTAQAKEGMGQPELQKTLSDSYEDIKKNADIMGIHGQAADDLAKKILGVPPNVDVKTWIEQTAAAQADALKKKLDGLDGRQIHMATYLTTFERRVGLPSQFSDGSAGQGAGVYAPGFVPPANPLTPKKAGGGDLDVAPGPKGVDSQLFIGAKGEHVLTAGEVDAMGGQQAVYRFRAQVRSGNVRGYAGGGGIGAIGSVASSRSLQGGAGRGIHVDLSGAQFTALDPVQLRRDITDDITYELNSKGGMRIV